MISGFCAFDPTPVPQRGPCRDLTRPSQAGIFLYIAPPSVTCCATCHRAPHGFWHGTDGTANISSLPHASLPLPVAAYGVLPPQDAAPLSYNTPHRMDALRHIGHGCVPIHAHTCGVQPDHGRTSRSGGSPAFHAPHKIVPLSALGIRGRNTASSVSLASLHLPSGKRKASAGFLPKRLSSFIFFLILL